MAALTKATLNFCKNLAQTRGATLAHYKSELMPPSPGDIPSALGGAAQLVKSGLTMKWMNMSVSQVAVNTFVGAEVLCWFFVGEIIGKRAFVGYNV